MKEYQSHWMADSTASTRQCQWRHYLRFCSEYDQVPLPAGLDTILLYIAFMAGQFKYVSLINYLSAVWVLHKVNGFSHIDPASFEIKMTLRGVRRSIGDTSTQARPIPVSEVACMHMYLDMSLSEEVAFWLAVLLCYRGLLRKSNVVEEGLAVRVSDVTFHPWGLLLLVRHTKTISFSERVLEIPFVSLPGSSFCVKRYLLLLLEQIGSVSDRQLISFRRSGVVVRGTYSWFSKKIKKMYQVAGLDPIT